MKTTHLLLTLTAIAATTAGSACKEDDGSTTSTVTTTTGTQGAGGGATVADQFASTFTLACDGPKDDPTSGSAATSMLERCIYDATAKTLALNLENGDQNGAIDIDLVGFHGAGTYPTSKDESGTHLYVSTGAVSAATHQSNPAGSFSAHACDLVVEETNLPEVAIPEGSAGHGYVVVSFDCGTLGAGAVGELTCTLTPSSFRFSVARCEAVK
jgi:hypothetical protein